jgi:N-acyl-D-aspartate/D-glutamate deacylase
VFDAIEEMKQARSRNNRLIAQVACTPLTMDFTLHSPYVFEGIDSWKPAMEAHGDAVKAVYADKGFRERVKADLVTLRGMRLFNSEWDKLNVVETAKEENRWQEGKTLEALAGAAGVHPLDYLLDLSLSENLDTLFTAVLLNTDKAAVGKLVSDPENHVALSDAGAHLTFLCDAGFGLHLMGHWARDQHALSLPEAIRKLTSQTADLFGITDRGRLKPGQAADMILFDPKTVGSGPRQRVHDLPTGAPRLTVKPVGLHGVWVNGKRIADETGVVANPARAGKLLRSFAAQ